MKSKNRSRVPVLMYHALEDETYPSGAKDLGEQVYVLHVEQFRQQMEYLRNAGFTALLLDELFSMETWPENAVVLTFDDGHQSNFGLALPILEECAFKAHFFVTTDWVGTPYFLTPAQIRVLSEKGMAIGSHGTSHRYFNEMSDNVIHEELQRSHDTLQAIIHKPVRSFSAPGGRITPRVIDIGLSLGYSLFCSSRFATMRQKDIPLDIPRYAMKAGGSLKSFSEVVQGGLTYEFRQTAKSVLLNLGKRILGNYAYERIRLAVINWCG